MVWGYSDRYIEEWSTATAEAGTNTHTFGTVPDGEVRVVTHVIMYNATSNPSHAVIFVYDGSSSYRVRYKVGPGAGGEVLFTGQLVLRKDDRIRVQWLGCVAGDDLYTYVFGYKMKVAE